MGSQHNPIAAHAASTNGRENEGDPIDAAELVLAWLSIAIGAGRVAQAFWLNEVWGAEASICLGLLVFGIFELARLTKARSRGK